MSRRDLLLYGTEQPPTVLRRFASGPLGFALDGGNVRYITWRGAEVLRAISFIVRDSKWGTYSPAIDNFRIEETPGRIEIAYDASVTGAEGDFHYGARIIGTAEGTLTFTADGKSNSGFATCRTGFVVLHGIAGVAGAAVAVEHASGGDETATFPLLVDPNQPILDIRTLTHSPQPGIRVGVTMEGDAYEMEDQRNWTDASYKTYVRPLSKGYPYRIPAGEPVTQRVTVKIGETARTKATATAAAAGVAIGEADGTMPEIGLALAAWSDPLPIVPSFVVGRIDLTSGSPELPAAVPEGVVDLDVLIPGRDPEKELAPLTALAFTPARVLVVPQRDMKMRPANETPPGEASYGTILAAARRMFPNSRVGGGMLVGFPEFNRNRPAAGAAFVAHSTSAVVHAADDHSVMETLETLASLIATTRSFIGSTSYRLGPATIGAPQAFYSSPSGANPENIRKTTAEADPRQRGLFAAAFAIGYAAMASAAGVEALTLGSTSGPTGLGGPDGPYPLATAICWLLAAAGRTRLRTEAPAGFAVIATQGVAGRQLIAANLTATPGNLAIAAFGRAAVLDVGAIESGNGPREVILDGTLPLDAYAIANLTDR